MSRAALLVAAAALALGASRELRQVTNDAGGEADEPRAQRGRATLYSTDGEKMRARRRRQIEQGRIRAENGLADE